MSDDISKDARTAWKHAKVAAELGQVCAVMLAVFGVAFGVKVFTTKTGDGFAAEQPFTMEGVAIMVAAVTVGACLYAAMAWLRFRAELAAPQEGGES